MSEFSKSLGLPQLLNPSLNLLCAGGGQERKSRGKRGVRGGGRASLLPMRIRPNFPSINVKGKGNPALGPEGSLHPITHTRNVHWPTEGRRWELLRRPPLSALHTPLL